MFREERITTDLGGIPPKNIDLGRDNNPVLWSNFGLVTGGTPGTEISITIVQGARMCLGLKLVSCRIPTAGRGGLSHSESERSGSLIVTKTCVLNLS